MRNHVLSTRCVGPFFGLMFALDAPLSRSESPGSPSRIAPGWRPSPFRGRHHSGNLPLETFSPGAGRRRASSHYSKSDSNCAAGSWSSSSAIRLRPHGSGHAAFPHPAPPGSHPHGAARGVQGCVIRGGGRGKHAVTVSNQSQPMRRFFWLRRLRQLNQMRRISCRNAWRERQLCGMPK